MANLPSEQYPKNQNFIFYVYKEQIKQTDKIKADLVIKQDKHKIKGLKPTLKFPE